ncbi:MAG: MerR family DNA-binding transcriptional regulator [Niameybacter sp.]
MGKYYSINEFSKILGVSPQTLRNWDNNGKLHPITLLVMGIDIILMNSSIK